MPDERPESFGQALDSAGFDAAVSMSDAPESAETPTAAQSEDGSSPSTALSSDAAPPEATPRESSPQPEPPRNPVPWADHDRVVKGFHQKLDAATEQLKTLGWAQQLPPEVGP